MRLQSPTREGCWLQSSLVHPDDEDRKAFWLQNPTVQKHSNFFTRKINQGKFYLSQNLLEQTLLNTCATYVTLKALKIIHLYVQGCEKRKPKHINTDWNQNRTGIIFFIKLDRYLSVEMMSSNCRATGLEQLLKLDGELAVKL